MNDPAIGERAGASEVVIADRLTKVFGKFVAVDHVSFTVHAGEIFGFLGPNGAGKTTTIKMLTGLVLPTSGEASVAGFDLRTNRAGVKRSIGYMSQLFSLYGDLTVDENIRFFSRISGVPEQERERRRDWVLEMAGLTGHVDRLTAELPLGWKQRLALGCAVLHEPPILFLDEPTSGVDPRSRRSFWELVNTLSERGTTIFVSTHYMEEAEYCHRLALMNRGMLVALDTPAALRRSMTEPILEVEADPPARAVESLLGAEGVLDAAMFGRHVHVVVSDVGLGQRTIAARLAENQVRAGEIKRITPSLEDVFVARIRAAGGAPV
ncbi:MAG TPA: ABC transporter ATP-binding protein [bacterium]|nr:ABC transporter ATP-binding protein [bacterium]